MRFHACASGQALSATGSLALQRQSRWAFRALTHHPSRHCSESRAAVLSWGVLASFLETRRVRYTAAHHVTNTRPRVYTAGVRRGAAHLRPRHGHTILFALVHHCAAVRTSLDHTMRQNQTWKSITERSQVPITERYLGICDCTYRRDRIVPLYV